MRKRSFLQNTTKLFRPFLMPAAMMFFVMILIEAAGALLPYIFGKSVDAVISHNSYLTFKLIASAFLTAIIGSVFLGWVREQIKIRYLDGFVEQSLSVASLSAVFGFSIGQHINSHSGVQLEVVNKGRYCLSSLMRTLMHSILPNVLKILITLIILFVFDWRVAFTALIFIIAYVVLAFKGNKKKFPEILNVQKKNLQQIKLQHELMQNVRLVINEAQEQKTLNLFKRFTLDAINTEATMWLNYIKEYYGYRIFIFMGQYLSLSVGAYLILIDQYSTGMFVTLFYWTSSIFGYLTSIIAYEPQAISNIAEIKKFYDILSIEPAIDTNEDGFIIENFQGKIEFVNVSFAYPSRNTVEQHLSIENEQRASFALFKLNFVIEPGMKAAFVGISGSGKSTIIGLICRFYDPTEGEILIDGIPLKKLNLRWLRSQIGIVEQNIELFDLSIKENILYSVPDNKIVKEEELQAVLKQASLEELLIKSSIREIDMVVGENGIKFSGGERQRIAIARALIKEPKILIFDEATSALDSINEKIISDSVSDTGKQRTAIIIAHRLSTIRDADIIFVISNGKIVAQANHNSLLQTCEPYIKLVKDQNLFPESQFK